VTASDGWTDRLTSLANMKRPEVEAVLGAEGTSRHPTRPADNRKPRTRVRQLGQSQPTRRSPESGGVGLWAEDGDSPVLLPVCLSVLEHGLRVMETDVPGSIGIGPYGRISALCQPASRSQLATAMCSLRPCQSRIGEDPLPFGRRQAPGCRCDLETGCRPKPRTCWIEV